MSNSTTTAADVTAGDNSDENIITAVGAVMIVLSVIVVGLRFYTRFSLKTGFGWDDWSILISLSSLLAAGVCVLTASIIDPDAAWLAVSYTDPDYVYTPANQAHLKLSWISSILYFSIVCPAKLSILLMYNRIFAISPSFRRQVYTMGALVTLFWITCTLANIFNCWPVKWSWVNSLTPAEYCFNFNIFWFATGIVEVVFDIIIIILPVNMVRRLQMSLKKRVGLTTVFLLGAFGIVTGAVRVEEAYLPDKRSPSYDDSEVWSSVHAGISIICACLPVCWPLLIKMPLNPMLSKLKGSTSTLRNRWNSRKGTWSSTPKLRSRESKEDLEHGERVYPQEFTDTKHLAVTHKNSSVAMMYPQQARLSNTNSSDGMIYIIQGGHYSGEYGAGHSVV